MHEENDKWREEWYDMNMRGEMSGGSTGNSVKSSLSLWSLYPFNPDYTRYDYDYKIKIWAQNECWHELRVKFSLRDSVDCHWRPLMISGEMTVELIMGGRDFLIHFFDRTIDANCYSSIIVPPLTASFWHFFSHYLTISVHALLYSCQCS